MRTCAAIAVGALLAVAASAPPQETKGTRNYVFSNGQWFDGKQFKPKTFYSINGVLQTKHPSRIDREFDLQGMYVLPACGEAHNHNATSQHDWAIDDYIQKGILYVKNPSNMPRFRQHGRINTAAGIDVLFSNGSLTPSGGHPLVLLKKDIQRGALTEADGDGVYYFGIDSLADIQTKWPQILNGKPDFIKINLVYSEEFEKRKNDEKYFSRRGLNPSLVKPIVERAHQSGFSVSAHVESAMDFHHAVQAGVDEISHLPGFWLSEEALAKGDFSGYRIREADAREAGRRRIRVVTSLNGVFEYLNSKADPATRESGLKLLAQNLALLRANSVTILIGSDQFRRTSQAEALSLVESGLMTKQELLKAWCETTPRSIFPKRRIGRLQDGYEANFLILPGDPLREFSAVKDVRMVFKHGEQLIPRE